ncbi:MAG: Tm-1-like ATP-binding domain-containing protein [Pirellulales bacterium]|nr:Tm-1-like ATP-binding domain-containing protein [Pirellulales bacterium]
MPQSIYLIATMDSKGREAEFAAQCIRSAGLPAVTVDVGTKDAPTVKPDIGRDRVLARHPTEKQIALPELDRGQAVTVIGEALVEFLRREFAADRVLGVLGLGGTGGTALIAPAMRALPIGVPKLLVSTVASGNTAPYVGCCDIALMPSVVDVAGLNCVSRQVLANAAHALAGMVAHKSPEGATQQALGMTMFGVTTPCVTQVRERLESQGFDCLVFHATGTGGQAMEKLVESGLLSGVLDITTTEVADEIVGGVFKAGPARFDVIFEKKIPYVMSLGALDMVNFGSRDAVPPQFRERKLHVHNAQVTLMRTTPEENRRCARWMAAKINRSTAPFLLLIPEKGVSMLDAPGKPFYDPEADRALFEELEAAVQTNSTRQIRRVAAHINEPEFAEALLGAFAEVSQIMK